MGLAPHLLLVIDVYLFGATHSIFKAGLLGDNRHLHLGHNMYFLSSIKNMRFSPVLEFSGLV